MTEDEAELVLDMLGPPEHGEDPCRAALRSKVSLLLKVSEIAWKLL
jgi:hypothetical protein